MEYSQNWPFQFWEFGGHGDPKGANRPRFSAGLWDRLSRQHRGEPVETARNVEDFQLRHSRLLFWDIPPSHTPRPSVDLLDLSWSTSWISGSFKEFRCYDFANCMTYCQSSCLNRGTPKPSKTSANYLASNCYLAPYQGSL